MNTKSGNAASVHRDYLELSARYGNSVAHPRQSSELRESVPAQRGPVAFGNLNTVV